MYEIEITEFLCPICVERILARWFVNTQTNIGERCVNVDVHANSIPATLTDRVFKQILVPLSILIKEEVFMNRIVLKHKLVTIGSYDEYGTYKFKKQLFKINEV